MALLGGTSSAILHEAIPVCQGHVIHWDWELRLQVDTTRALARDEYRLTQVADKQKAWKGNVAKLKDAQDSVKTTRENFYR